MQRDRQCAQIRSLLARRDYGALAAMDKELPPQLAKLARHLAARSELQMKEAAKLARGMTLPFKLYPALDATDERYRLLSEYYLLLRNLQRTQRYTEFVLRLNPFLTQLLLRLIEQNLPCPLGSILETRGNIHTSARKGWNDMPRRSSRLLSGRWRTEGKISELTGQRISACTLASDDACPWWAHARAAGCA